MHTPGPWEKIYASGHDYIISKYPFDTGRTTFICRMEDDLHNDEEDNAKFIVLACNVHDELLKTCEELLFQLDDTGGSRNSEEAEIRNKARVIIAKAKGD